jgi:beta-galactosidase
MPSASLYVYSLALLILPAALTGCATTGPAPSPRHATVLHDNWRFHLGDPDGAPQPTFDRANWQRVTVPHTWNTEDGQDGGNNYHRGPAWYYHQLQLPERPADARLFLHFGAANTLTDVYLDGTKLGQHRGGHSAFCFEITDHVKGAATANLAVRVDNSHFDDIPPWSADFTFFGGLYRNVTLLTTGPHCITPLDHAGPGVYIHTPRVTDESATVVVNTKLSTTNPPAENLHIATTIFNAAGQAVASDTSALTNTTPAEPHQQTLTVRNPHRWHGREDPYLYSVQVQLRHENQVVDQVTQPLGIRTYHVDPDHGFFLNGRPYHLHGVNRHQDRINKGWAIGPAEHDEDLQILMDMGATTVRFAHYQHDEYAYRRCDELGLVVWAEIPLVNRINDTPEFTANTRNMLTELIRQNFNHPSICFWGLHNEVTAPWEPGPDPTALIQKLHQLAKREDPSRLTTCAACTPFEHPANWCTDVVAFNRYFGWYEREPADFIAWIDRMHRAHPDAPIAMSEYGAGASIHHHEPWPPNKPVHNAEWHPEEWQAYLHEIQYTAMADRPFVWGAFVWNGFDFASDARNEGDLPGRNDKGLVTYDRTVRKDAWWWYAANWSDEPLVHIVSRRFTPRKQETATIRVYTNCPSVRLTVNGQQIGTQPAKHHIATWQDIPLRPGENKIHVTGPHPKGNCHDHCTWQRTTE